MAVERTAAWEPTTDSQPDSKDAELTTPPADDVTRPPLRTWQQRDRRYKTVCLCICFTTLGLCAPLVGMTIVHMEQLFDSDTATMSQTFTAHAVGYLSGGMLCGLIFDRFNRELLFTAANTIQSVTTIAAPFAGNFYRFAAILSVQGATQGFIDAGGQSYCVGLWTGHGLKEPILQAAHAIWSLGATVGPFVIGAFLVDLDLGRTDAADGNDVDGRNGTLSAETIGGVSNASSSLAKNGTSGLVSSTDGMTQQRLAAISEVRFAYVTIGALILVSSAMFLVAYCRGRSLAARGRHVRVVKPESEEERPTTAASERKPRYNLYLVLFLVLVFVFFHLYAYVELIPGAFFTSFAIKYLHWPVHHASLLMAVFFGCLCVGRVLGVPLSAALRPRTMLAINLVLTAVAYCLLLGVDRCSVLLWPSAALAGVSMASTFPTAILWTSETIAVSGRVAAVPVVGSSVGGLVSPLVVGRLFDAVSPMCVVYALVVASLGHLGLFGCLAAFVGRYRKSIGDGRAGDGRGRSGSEVVVVVAGEVGRLLATDGAVEMREGVAEQTDPTKNNLKEE